MNKKSDRTYLKIARTESLKEHNNRCVYCFEPLTQKTVTADHKIPKSKGGSNRKTNIVPCCVSCNQLKGSLGANAFKNKIKAATYPENGLDWRMLKFRRNINIKLDRMEARVMKAVTKPDHQS